MSEYINGIDAPPSASALSFSHLTYTTKTKTGPKVLIRDFSLTVHEGEMVGKVDVAVAVCALFADPSHDAVAIMGPSGAGMPDTSTFVA